MHFLLPPLQSSIFPRPAVSGLRVSGQERQLERSLSRTCRGSTGLWRGKGWGELSAEGKGPENSQGTKAPPRCALSLLGPEGGSGRWGSVKSTESAFGARPGGVAPRASAGRLVLRDLNPEAAGLAAES